jgi:hypothetical protein
LLPNAGRREVSPSAFAQRFTTTTSVFLPELRATALDRCFTMRPALRRFNGVYLRDGIVVVLPDAKKLAPPAWTLRMAGTDVPNRDATPPRVSPV